MAVTKKAITPFDFEGQKPGTSGLRSKEKIHVDMSEMQDVHLRSIDDIDSGLAIDLEANHAGQTPASDVGCLSRIHGFLVIHMKRVYEIVRASCTEKIHVDVSEMQDVPLGSIDDDPEANHAVKPPAAYVGCVSGVQRIYAIVHAGSTEKIQVDMSEPQDIPLDSIHDPVTTLAVYIGRCVSRVGGFLVNHIKRVYAIVRAGYTAVMGHCTAAGDQMEEQQKRCYEYSKKAFASECCTLLAYILSPVVSSIGRATLFITMATLFLAMITDVISWKTKPKWGRALVYLSSFLQMLTTFLVFISLDKAYGYAFISVPVLIFVSIGRAFFQHEQQLHGDDKADVEDHLDRIFDFSAFILNWGAPITAILCHSMEDTDTAASITGFFFIFTVILSLYFMMVTTLRDVALTPLATYLHYSQAALLFGTLIATIISFTTGKKT